MKHDIQFFLPNAGKQNALANGASAQNWQRLMVACDMVSAHSGFDADASMPRKLMSSSLLNGVFAIMFFRAFRTACDTAWAQPVVRNRNQGMEELIALVANLRLVSCPAIPWHNL